MRLTLLAAYIIDKLESNQALTQYMLPYINSVGSKPNGSPATLPKKLACTMAINQTTPSFQNFGHALALVIPIFWWG